MKKAILACLSIVLMMACKPEIKPIGEAQEAGAGVVGTWKMSGASITDITQAIPETRDVSTFYAKAANAWTFTFLENGTYSVDVEGAGPKIFSTGGAWAFDQTPFPSAITLTPLGGGDPVELTMENMPRERDTEFGFTFTLEKCATPYISYTFNFERQ